MTDLAWMKTWIGDEAAKIRPLTTEEFGAYELLRRQYWTDGSLPNDDARLRRITGIPEERWPDVRSAICGLFEEGWRLPALDLERGDAADKRERKIAAGKKGAEKRWNGKPNAPANGRTVAEPMAEPMGVPMADAMEDHWQNDSHQHQRQTTYAEEERLAPTHAHARTREPDPDTPIDAPASDADGLAFLRRSGLGPKGIAQALPKLMGGRLYRDVLDQIAMQLGDA